MRIAVTGAAGRLGRALIAELGDAAAAGPDGPQAWDRSAFDLDAPDGVGARIEADRIELVIHAAAWTDVDACALEPALATRRNGDATGILARACAERGVDLVVISTNEVFDGTRTDGRPYAPTDAPRAANPYGASKLGGELAAAAAYAARGAAGTLGIVRTAWLFGPGKPDFPSKIAAAARRATAAGEPLRVVGDEVGTPTSTPDLAAAILELVEAGATAGLHHLVNAGRASRAEWARDVLARLGLAVEIVEVGLADFPRPSRPPRWGVLAPTPLPSGNPLRPWPEAMAEAVSQWREPDGART